MRQTDRKPVHCFRSDRFFVVSGRWYFTTREQEDFGPFDSREEAETRLAQYLDTQWVMQRLREDDPAKPRHQLSMQRVARLARDVHVTRAAI